MHKVCVLVGTRPNFVKITQFRKVAANFADIDLRIIHSNQHYSDAVSSVFFDQFKLKIDHFLTPYYGNPAGQLGHIIEELSVEFLKKPVDLLLVVGDVNTTLAGAIVANKLNIKLGHIESGLRSFDRSMPEEINRILVDEICDLYFVTEQSGVDNLLNETRNKEFIHFVGNTMIDTLVAFKSEIDRSVLPFERNEKDLVSVTLHRPSNVDTENGLNKILDLLKQLTSQYQVVFPIHPRTENRFKELGLYNDLLKFSDLHLIQPLDYFRFQKLISISRAVVTDSGGIQEETTFLKIPCVTLRENTERPVTVEQGTNILMSFEPEKIVDRINSYDASNSIIPPMWDGKSTQRVFEVIHQYLS